MLETYLIKDSGDKRNYGTDILKGASESLAAYNKDLILAGNSSKETAANLGINTSNVTANSVTYSSIEQKSTTDAYVLDKSGYYSLSDNFTMAEAADIQKTSAINVKNSENSVIVVDLNGKTIDGNSKYGGIVSSNNASNAKFFLLDTSKNLSGKIYNCQRDDDGPGLHCDGNMHYIYDATFQECSSPVFGDFYFSRGGATFIASGRTLNIYSAIYTGNSAYSSAGAICVRGNLNITPNTDTCVVEFIGNKTKSYWKNEYHAGLDQEQRDGGGAIADYWQQNKTVPRSINIKGFNDQHPVAFRENQSSTDGGAIIINWGSGMTDEQGGNTSFSCENASFNDNCTYLPKNEDDQKKDNTHCGGAVYTNGAATFNSTTFRNNHTCETADGMLENSNGGAVYSCAPVGMTVSVDKLSDATDNYDFATPKTSKHIDNFGAFWNNAEGSFNIGFERDQYKLNAAAAERVLTLGKPSNNLIVSVDNAPQTATFTASVDPEGDNDQFSAESLNKDVATVSSYDAASKSFTITPVGGGTAKIKVTCKDASVPSKYDDLEKIIEVNVDHWKYKTEDKGGSKVATLTSCCTANGFSIPEMFPEKIYLVTDPITGEFEEINVVALGDGENAVFPSVLMKPTSINIPQNSNIVKIADYAFLGKDSIENVTLNSSDITYIGKLAFVGTGFYSNLFETNKFIKAGAYAAPEHEKAYLLGAGKAFFENKTTRLDIANIESYDPDDPTAHDVYAQLVAAWAFNQGTQSPNMDLRKIIINNPDIIINDGAFANLGVLETYVMKDAENEHHYGEKILDNSGYKLLNNKKLIIAGNKEYDTASKTGAYVYESPDKKIIIKPVEYEYKAYTITEDETKASTHGLTTISSAGYYMLENDYKYPYPSIPEEKEYYNRALAFTTDAVLDLNGHSIDGKNLVGGIATNGGCSQFFLIDTSSSAGTPSATGQIKNCYCTTSGNNDGPALLTDATNDELTEKREVPHYIYDTVFYNNYGGPNSESTNDDRGGAVWVSTLRTLNIYSALFKGNHAGDYGGAIVTRGNLYIKPNTDSCDVTFDGNYADNETPVTSSELHNGGGAITDQNNGVSAKPQNIHMEGYSQSHPLKFINNHSAFDGGAINIYYANTVFTCLNAQFGDKSENDYINANYVTKDGACGGAIYTKGTTGIGSTAFYGNHTSEKPNSNSMGGALFSAHAESDQPDVTIDANCCAFGNYDSHYPQDSESIATNGAFSRKTAKTPLRVFFDESSGQNRIDPTEVCQVNLVKNPSDVDCGHLKKKNRFGDIHDCAWEDAFEMFNKSEYKAITGSDETGQYIAFQRDEGEGIFSTFNSYYPVGDNGYTFSGFSNVPEGLITSNVDISINFTSSDIPTHANLYEYTLAELKQVSSYLQELDPSEYDTDEVYQHFYQYTQNAFDQDSTGYTGADNGVPIKDPSGNYIRNAANHWAIDKNGKTPTEEGYENNSPDTLQVRLIGLCQDVQTKGKPAPFTFMATHSLENTTFYTFTESFINWKDSSLRSEMSDNLSTHAIASSALDVTKRYSDANDTSKKYFYETDDKFFAISLTEVGIDVPGSEWIPGYYDWEGLGKTSPRSSYFAFDATKEYPTTNIIKNLNKTQNGDFTSDTSGLVWYRTVHDWYPTEIFCINAINGTVQKSTPYSENHNICPCFCL